MSIIHDALKKAEKERQGDKAPSVPVNVILPGKKTSSMPLAVPLLVILVLMVMATGGYYYYQRFIRGNVKSVARMAVPAVPAPVPTDLLMGKAMELYQSGDMEGSLKIWRDLEKTAPGDASVYNNEGVILKKMGLKDEARAAYERALEIKAGYPEALNNMGSLSFEEGNIEAAKTHLEKALALKPDYAEAYFHLGLVEEEKGEAAVAAGHYKSFLNYATGIDEAFREKIRQRIASLETP